jgi:thioesterase domain-containing protein
MPQTSMEHWLESRVRQTLADVPCARAVIIGHSHGGVTATAVAVALEGEYADRMLVVLIDRTDVLYDRVADEMPQRAHVLNFYQLNEGWHGEPIDQPNVENIDESDERAPLAPSDGGAGEAIVSHKTLDDALAVQRAVVERAVAWASGD